MQDTNRVNAESLPDTRRYCAGGARDRRNCLFCWQLMSLKGGRRDLNEGLGIIAMNVTTKTKATVKENLAQFPVARGDRVADQVYRHLRQAIGSGEIGPGTRLRERHS